MKYNMIIDIYLILRKKNVSVIIIMLSGINFIKHEARAPVPYNKHIINMVGKMT